MQNKINTKIATLEAELANLKQLLNQKTANYWQPKNDERYWYVNHIGCVLSDKAVSSASRYKVFQTEAEAQKYADYIKAEETIRKAIAEANEYWNPNWYDGSYKYSVTMEFKLPNAILTVDSNSYYKGKPTFLYVKSRVLAEQLIKDYEKEFLTYLSY